MRVPRKRIAALRSGLDKTVGASNVGLCRGVERDAVEPCAWFFNPVRGDLCFDYGLLRIAGHGASEVKCEVSSN